MTETAASKGVGRTWVQITIAALVIACLGVAATIGGLALFAFRHIERQSVSAAVADAEFAKVRARFVRDQAMIEVSEDRDVMIHPNPGTGEPIHSIHLLAYNPTSGRLVNADMPVWLLRFGRRASISLIDEGEFGTGGTHLTLDDIERHGPGLILDHRRVNGAQAIVWAE